MAEEAKPRRPAGRSGSRREAINVAHGIACVQATFNNTIVTITDMTGNVVAWASAGSVGFKGSRKSTPFAAQRAADSAAQKAMDHGMREVRVYVKGRSSRESGRSDCLQAKRPQNLTVGSASADCRWCSAGGGMSTATE